MSIKSIWTTEDLQSLTQIDNHKIMFDGYEYYWVRKLKDKWERHYIINFKDKKKAFSYLKYSIGKWEKELVKRISKVERIASYKEIERILYIQEKTFKIANSMLPTIEKINHLKLVNKGITADELSNLLNLKTSIVYRHIRTLKSKGTLLCA